MAPRIWETERVSSQGGRKNPAAGAGRSGHRRVPRQSRLPDPPPNALFAEMLKASRELLAVRSPLDAELMVSELLGTWWGERGPGSPSGSADLDELIGEGLVEYAAGHPGAAAAAGTAVPVRRLAPPGAEQLADHQLGVERASHGQQLPRGP